MFYLLFSIYKIQTIFEEEVFKTETELKGFLMSQLKNVIIKMQEQVYKIIDRFIKELEEKFGIVELARTGITSLQRGAGSFTEDI